MDTILKVDNLRMNQIGPVVSEKIFYKVYDGCVLYTDKTSHSLFCQYFCIGNRIGGVMVSVLVSNAVVRGFKL